MPVTTKDATPELNLEHKQAPAGTGVGLLGADDETGVVEAIVSVTGIRDAVSDRIIPGAYAKTIAARNPKGIFGHDWGRWTAKTLEAKELMPGDPALPKHTPQGQPWPAAAGAVYVKAQFNLNTTDGRDAYQNVKFFGPECEWSVGYQVPPRGAVKAAGGGRDIKQMDWYEYSPVLFGAAPMTGTLDIKAATAGPPGDDDEDGRDAGDPSDPVTEQADAGDPDIAALHEAAMTEMDEQQLGWDAIDAASAIDAGEEGLAGAEDEYDHDQHDGGDGSGKGAKAIIVEGDDGPYVLEIKDAGGARSARVSDKPWSDFKAADYSPAQYHRACLIHDHGPGVPDDKDHCKLPVREPSGTLNRNGVHAAAAALAGSRGGVDAPDEAKGKARAALRGHYRTLGEEPPESLTESKAAGQEVTPADVAATDRLRHWYTHGGGAAEIDWGTPGDFARCSAIAGKHMRPDQAHGFCQLRHKDATGFYAGHAPSEQIAHGGIARKDLTGLLDGTAAGPGGYDPHLETGDLAGGADPWAGLELKAADPAGAVLEAPAVPDGRSLEEYADMVADAVTAELGGAEQLPGGMPRHLVVVNGTWPGHVIATRIDTAAGPDAAESYQIGVDWSPDGSVELGDPQPVTLTVSDDGPGTKGLEDYLSGYAMLVEHVTGVMRRGTMQVKDGRVLSQVNANLLRGAILQLLSVVRSAGIDIEPDGKMSDAEEAGSQSDPLYLPDSTAPAAQPVQVKSSTAALALLDPELRARAMRITAAAHGHRDDDAGA